jgi:hypothetical protein
MEGERWRERGSVRFRLRREMERECGALEVDGEWRGNVTGRGKEMERKRDSCLT